MLSPGTVAHCPLICTWPGPTLQRPWRSPHDCLTREDSKACYHLGSWQYPLTSKFTMDTWVSRMSMIIPQEILALPLSLRKVPELALARASFPDSHVVSLHPGVGGASKHCSSPTPIGCWEADVPGCGLDCLLCSLSGLPSLLALKWRPHIMADSCPLSSPRHDKMFAEVDHATKESKSGQGAPLFWSPLTASASGRL